MIILIYLIRIFCKYIVYVSIPFFNFHILVDLLKAPDLSLLLSFPCDIAMDTSSVDTL